MYVYGQGPDLVAGTRMCVCVCVCVSVCVF